jgi:hypothetical protein
MCSLFTIGLERMDIPVNEVRTGSLKLPVLMVLLNVGRLSTSAERNIHLLHYKL